jgi:hypothetical protein
MSYDLATLETVFVEWATNRDLGAKKARTAATIERAEARACRVAAWKAKRLAEELRAISMTEAVVRGASYRVAAAQFGLSGGRADQAFARTMAMLRSGVRTRKFPLPVEVSTQSITPQLARECAFYLLPALGRLREEFVADRAID